MWPTGEPSRPSPTSGITDVLHWHPLTRVWNGFWKYAKPWTTGPTLPWFGLGFMPRHPLKSYCLWQCLILDVMKISMDFSPYDAFPSSDIPEMVNIQNSWNLLVISTYLLHLEWNLGMLAADMCILWLPTARCTMAAGSSSSFDGSASSRWWHSGVVSCSYGSGATSACSSLDQEAPGWLVAV
jgi:hypothetical protein